MGCCNTHVARLTCLSALHIFLILTYPRPDIQRRDSIRKHYSRTPRPFAERNSSLSFVISSTIVALVPLAASPITRNLSDTNLQGYTVKGFTLANTNPTAEILSDLPKMNTSQKILLGVLLPLLIAFVYLIYRIIAGKYLRKLYPTNDIEADRVKSTLDQGGRPPPTDFHSTALDSVSRMSWRGLLTGKHDTADALGYTTPPPRTPRTRRNTSESTRTILRRTPDQSSRSLVTGYESGEEYEMHPTTVPINVPAPPTFVHPHLASSLGTQVHFLPPENDPIAFPLTIHRHHLKPSSPASLHPARRPLPSACPVPPGAGQAATRSSTAPPPPSPDPPLPASVRCPVVAVRGHRRRGGVGRGWGWDGGVR